MDKTNMCHILMEPNQMGNVMAELCLPNIHMLKSKSQYLRRKSYLEINYLKR